MPLPPVRAVSLCVAAALAFIAAQARADAASSAVRVNLESVDSLDIKRAQADDAASFASAERMEGSLADELELIGNAEVRRGGAVFTADRITYRHDTDEVTGKGNARISRAGASFSGPSMRFRITSREGSMDEAEWEYAPRNVRGCAKNIRFLSGNRTTFEDVSFTTCKRDDDSWFISMNDLEIDEYDLTASGTGAVLHFQNVPIFASPWFAFPISNQRRSGFLTPTYGMSSTRGVDISIPYYFNIAPNYDYTLTPRVMTKRGVMLGNEARFKYDAFNAQVNLDYLPSDRTTKENRWSTRIQADYQRDKLGANIDYNRVSDDDFITDFSGNIRESSESVLPQDYSLTWTDTYWNSLLRVTKNQTLKIDGGTTVVPYERVPQMVLNAYNSDFHGFEFTTTVDATRFTHPTRLDGTRVVLEQSASYPLRGAGWFIVPKAQIQGAWYQLNNLSRDHQYTDKSPSFVVPTFTLDAGLVFERDSHFFGREAYQTLEPRIYYAYTPYRDQSDIPIFDTTVSDLSFASLFTPNLYAGYDRVSEASSLNRMMNVKTGLVWQPKRRSTIGVFYRYNYSAGSVTDSTYDDNIKQVDFSVQWPITERLYGLLRYNYSLYQKKPIELIGGFEYLHDCWTLRFAAQRYTTASNEQESNFFLQLELNGLGSIGINPISELRRNIRGYQTTGPLPTTADPYDYYE